MYTSKIYCSYSGNQYIDAQNSTHLTLGIALTKRNTTGPPSRAASWWVTLHMRRCYRRRQTTTTDDDRRQRPLLVWPTYTVCRRASKITTHKYSDSRLRKHRSKKTIANGAPTQLTSTYTSVNFICTRRAEAEALMSTWHRRQTPATVTSLAHVHCV